MSKYLFKKPQIVQAPEINIAKARRARIRFKTAIRFVIDNLSWIIDLDEINISDNVQRNIWLLSRARKQKSLISLQDKFIFNKKAEFRTDIEKLRITRVINGLNCFRRYPKIVIDQLAEVTYMVYYGPGRTIIKQGHESQALYFIISGNAAVYQDSYDPLFKELTRSDLGVLEPGTMFGEVALLHNIPRTATVISKTPIELFCVNKKDFNLVLKATVKQEWDRIQRSMRHFSYFLNWDEVSVRECCILGKLRNFAANETILGDGYGLHNCIYFILRGSCRVIEHLMVTSETRAGRKHYKLYKPQTITELGAAPKNHKSSPASCGNNVFSKKEKNELIVRSKEKLCRSESAKQHSEVVKRASRVKSSINESIGSNKRESTKLSLRTGTSLEGRRAPSNRVSCVTNILPEVETHFMQVCFLERTACFSVGENMDRRRVQATQPTDCLLIPRAWVLKKPNSNFVNQVRRFLNQHIPTTEDLFNEFINHRKWLDYRRKLVDDILSTRKLVTNNTMQNVPYSIRINEQIDIY